MITVLLVDDHEIVREGIKHIVQNLGDVQIIGEAKSGEEAIEYVRHNKPDVILMDVNMKGIGGIEATRKIKKAFPNVRVIGLTVHTDTPSAASLLKAGAMGYVTKGCPVEEIRTAIETVHNGGRYVAAEIAQGLALSLLPGGEESPFSKLSQREMQVMMMVTRGQGIQEISDLLCLSPKTISTYRYRLYEKLEVENDVELTRLAIRHGISLEEG